MVCQVVRSNLSGREHNVSYVPRDLFEYTCTSIPKIPIFPEAICKMSQIIADQKPGNQEFRKPETRILHGQCILVRVLNTGISELAHRCSAMASANR